MTEFVVLEILLKFENTVFVNVTRFGKTDCNGTTIDIIIILFPMIKNLGHVKHREASTDGVEHLQGFNRTRCRASPDVSLIL